ncbi:helix-turn-helix domain-containing protein [Sphingobacterium humi]|uniref:Helix-turn-helix domain-containing protein n=1 Tax=Sphingobacterium humi TaxID=1796905 RepID=A0A6N8L538_9SPHI|nr:AraC family transcriptional regulator [Sphingobacterium humi]MVZ64139.1 helix-turn-helix domain-containing protein [Sphingobacterium humi]
MKHKTLLLLCCSLTLANLGYGQRHQASHEYHMIYDELATDKKAGNLPYTNMAAKGSDEEINKLMLKAHQLFGVSDYAGSLKASLQAEKIANLTGLPEWKTNISIFIAATFRVLGLHEQAFHYMESAENACDFIKDPEKKQFAKINLLQEQALFKVGNKAYRQAIPLIDSARIISMSLDKEKSNARLVLARNEQILGTCFLENNDPRRAIMHFRHGLTFLKPENTVILPFIYRGLAEVYLRQGMLDSCGHYIKLLEPYVAKTERIHLKEQLYQTSINYYKAIDNLTVANDYYELKLSVLNKQNILGQEVSSHLIKELNMELINARKYKLLFWWIVSICGISLVSLFIYQYRYKRIQKPRYIPVVKKEVPKPDEVPLQLVREIASANDTEFNIALETESRLVKELADLEQEYFFLDKDISLNKLAIRLSTNQKYVSFIIKKYRNMDFNHYLQYKKVQYLIDRIAEDSSLLEYKLAYLAEMAGFSSHSKFTIAFKSVMGKTPSQYIDTLKSRQQA